MSSPFTNHRPFKVSAKEITLWSDYLNRPVLVSLILPSGYDRTNEHPPELVIFQDGQDFPTLHIRDSVEKLLRADTIPAVILAGVHAGAQRLSEYGIASRADYQGRGNRAKQYSQFICRELIPFIRQNFSVNTSRPAIAGFSLGGLTALDIAWCNPEIFAKAGIFSGSLWWRQKDIGREYSDSSDRIMHQQIRNTVLKPDLKLWFQTGTNDEVSDRDGDGVIDSIGDTLDCIAELERKGFKWKQDVFYTEVKGGNHSTATWQKIMPDFLKWVLT